MARLFQSKGLLLLSSLLLLGQVVACGSEGAAPDVRMTGVDTTIYGGASDDNGIGGVVALRVGTGGKYELCTGALIAPNVVLTARHCVTRNTTTSVACDENGNSANGKHVESAEDPADVAIFLGAEPSFSGEPAARAKAIVGPASDYLCDTDIATIVLDRAIDSVTPLAIRLDGTARTGETIRSVGYGNNDREVPVGTRLRKEGVEVLAMGKAVSASKTPLGAHEFEVGLSICQGDSGGPAISETTGAVIGVVSRGGDCSEDHGHIYTTTAGFEDMFHKAFAIAGGAPTVEAGQSTVTTHVGQGGPTPNEEEPRAGVASCSSSPREVTGGGVFAVALAAAMVLARRRRL